ncbi:MAG: hypothetical protein JWO13_3890 [Acidobacteriales bacterium]|nr:hypothetical protein [Terriglobales bacterium]
MQMHRRTGLGGWISPEGRYWPCPDLLHNQIAERIVRRLSLPSTSRFGAQLTLEGPAGSTSWTTGVSFPTTTITSTRNRNSTRSSTWGAPVLRCKHRSWLPSRRSAGSRRRQGRHVEQLPGLDDGAVGATARQPSGTRGRTTIADGATVAQHLGVGPDEEGRDRRTQRAPRGAYRVGPALM